MSKVEIPKSIVGSFYGDLYDKYYFRQVTN